MTYVNTPFFSGKVRGLDILAAFSAAKVLEKIYPDAGDAAKQSAAFEAERMGLYEYLQGVVDMPVVFEQEPDLMWSWKSGQEAAEEMSQRSEIGVQEAH